MKYPVAPPVIQIPNAHVAILLATYNGERFLEEQLATVASQSVTAVDVWASDDGSSDRTVAILEAAQRTWTKGEFRILRGPGRGFAENFRSLLLNPSVSAEYYAYCDQDDLWDEDKLAHAIQWVAEDAQARPRLFCSRTLIVDAAGMPTGFSPLFRKRPSFQNAIVQSIAGGNTMVLNGAAREVIRASVVNTRFVSHDWWSYIVVTGAGGQVHYDATPRVRYRQHGQNLVGSNNSWRARLRRLASLREGQLARWTAANILSLGTSDLLTEEAKHTLAKLTDARKKGGVFGLIALASSGVYRQTLLGQIGLYLACLVRKL